MTYRCGIGPGIPGLEPGPPHIFCDVCGRRFEAKARRGGPPSWLLNGKAPRGWRVVRTVNGTRQDYCPEHK